MFIFCKLLRSFVEQAQWPFEAVEQAAAMR